MDAFTHRDGELFAEGIAAIDAAIEVSRRETIEDLCAGESLLSR